MTRMYFQPIKTWAMSEFALAYSLREMASDGARGVEGIVLWLGRRADGRADVVQLVALRGSGVIKQPDFLRVEPWLLNEVADLSLHLGLILIGQIHSHGMGYSPDLCTLERVGDIGIPYSL